MLVSHLESVYNLTKFWEETFSFESTAQWMERRFYCTYIIVASYLIGLYVSVKVMENRKPFDLRRVLTIWNVSLAVFSFSGAWGTLPELFHVLQHHGLHHSICNNSYVHYKRNVFWGLAFVLSKVPELADTFFIVARKQKLTFLHCFHHAWTVMFCWYGYPSAPSMARWTFTMNYSVHAVMYSYYALRSCGYRLSRKIAILITTSQILQMIVGFLFTIYTAVVFLKGERCDLPVSNLVILLITYSSLFGLFLNFFVRTYLTSPTKTSSKKE